MQGVRKLGGNFREKLGWRNWDKALINGGTEQGLISQKAGFLRLFPFLNHRVNIELILHIVPGASFPVFT